MISNFNSGTTVTFPLYIFGAAQRGIPVEVNVLATMLFMVTAVAMIGFTIWQQRRAEKLAAMPPEQEGDPRALHAGAGGARAPSRAGVQSLSRSSRTSGAPNQTQRIRAPKATGTIATTSLS